MSRKAMKERAQRAKGGRLRRADSTRDLPPELVVVCEGGTEERIVKALRSRWRIAAVRVEVLPNRGVPSTVVKIAKKERRTSTEVWVCFDRDEHPCWSSAIDTARACELRLAVSNPCVELFGLLLHGDQRAHIDRHAAQSELKKLHPGYDHHRSPFFDVDTVDERWRDALRRADECVRDAEDDLQNPSTSFPRLVERLHDMRGALASRVPE